MLIPRDDRHLGIQEDYHEAVGLCKPAPKEELINAYLEIKFPVKYPHLKSYKVDNREQLVSTSPYKILANADKNGRLEKRIIRYEI